MIAEAGSPLVTQYVRRFTPDYKAAFLGWLKTSPFTNPAAPALAVGTVAEMLTLPRA